MAQLSITGVLNVFGTFADNTQVLLLIISTYPWAQAEHEVALLFKHDVHGKLHEIQTELPSKNAPG